MIGLIHYYGFLALAVMLENLDQRLKLIFLINFVFPVTAKQNYYMLNAYVLTVLTGRFRLKTEKNLCWILSKYGKIRN